MAASFSTADIKARLSELIGRVTHTHERLIVLRRGKPVAAIVSIEDLRRLESLDAAQAKGDDIHPIMRAYGGWADRDDLDELIAEIYANRETAIGRQHLPLSRHPPGDTQPAPFQARSRIDLARLADVIP
jgi:prevent-host-death family protein